MSERSRTFNIVIAALGGEGGGVLADWISEVARREGWQTQTTSVPGVAQRTGATIYYIEIFPKGERAAVMSLFPTQGDVDLVIASEIVEAGRMVQRGLVTPERTGLIASDHRVYGIAEKVELTNGIVDAAVLTALCQKHARRFIHFDLLALAREHNTVISATLFGAVAGAAVLPFSNETFERVIEASGIQVNNNLSAFRASRDRAQTIAQRSGTDAPADNRTAEVETELSDSVAPVFELPRANTTEGVGLLHRVARFPVAVQPILVQGLERLVDYQNATYAGTYLNRLEEFASLLDADDLRDDILREIARYLATWMSFEDIARVAQLKTRAERLQDIREEVMAEADQLIYVTEYFSPRVEEFCAYLPNRMARYILGSRRWRRGLSLFTGGRRIRSNTITAYLMLRGVAALRRLRLKTYGYTQELNQIDAWLGGIRHLLTSVPSAESGQAMQSESALELARCGRLIKGYGETRERGQKQMQGILKALLEQGASAEAIIRLREAAFADDQGVAFREALGAN